MSERPEATRRLDEELRVIRGLGLSGFFLLHFDLLELAREVAVEVRGPDSARNLLPPGRGRGSSVSSVVCYLTGLSHVDPVQAGLFLGRFLNDEITEMPDIDLDFPRDIRERLIPRVHERYGRDRAALVSTFACYRSRGAVRDLGKALGLPASEIERVAGIADVYSRGEEIERDVAEAIGAGRAGSPRWRCLARLAREAWGLPRHISQHPGGMVLSTQPLIDICPVQPAAMEGRQVVQWDKDSCADAGFLKIDLLGLGMLSAVERCVEQVAEARGERIDLSRIPLDDPATFEAIRAAETTGVFQIESRAQMQMLPRSRPETIDDVIVQVALVRPGPIQGGAVHPYLQRRKRLREDPSFEIPYEHPDLEPILSDTLGAIVFQDQVIQVAMTLAGFPAGEAEGLRRAMSRKRSEEALNAYGERFVAGAVGRGVDRALAERVFEQVRGFSGFGFPKSHAAAFGLLAYQSTWLRVHYGPELLCALFNEQPMGFYPPDTLTHEAQRRGVEVRPVDVNRSDVECSVEPGSRGEPAVRLGLGYVKGIVEEEARGLVAERERGGPYRDLADLASRSGMNGDGLERLAWAGACEALGVAAGSAPRRDELWRLGVARGGERMRGRPVRPARPAAAPPRLAGAATARLLGAHRRRLHLDRDQPRRAPGRGPAAAARPAADGDRGAGDDPRRGDDRGRRAGGGAPAAGDRQGGRVHAAGGRGRRGQRDRPAAGLRALPAGRADGRLHPGRRQAGAPRGSREPARLVGRAAAGADRGRRRGAPHRAARRPRARPRCGALRRPPKPTRRSRCASWPRSLRPLTASAGAGRCKMGCRTYVLSELVPRLRQVNSMISNSSLARRVLGGVDLAIDLATLGEYGLEPLDEAARGDADEHCRERPGHVAGWEALAKSRPRGRCRERDRAPERQRAARRAAL